MIKQSILKALLVVAAMAIPSTLTLAQQGKGGGHGHDAQAPATAHVDFGMLPALPLGPAPCFGNEVPPAVVRAPGSAGDPCAWKIHVLTPEESFVAKGGEVTFQFHGGGHGIAIYRVDEDTTRDEVGQFLCAGPDPADSHDFITTVHPCPTQSPANAAALHEVKDGDGEVVIVASPNVTNVHPDNRVWSPSNRLVSAGGVQFMNGGTLPLGATGTGPTGGQLVTYQFLKNGRYIVICMNRSHFLNDWMFGFVNVHGDDQN